MTRKRNDTMKTQDCWEIVGAVVRYSRTLLLHGVPGTGKTFAGQHAALDGRGLVNVTLTPDTPAAELRGHYIPVGGEFRWTDGPVIKAWREGARLVINEIDHAGGDALSFLLAALDTPATAAITLPTGETVRPAPGFQCVGTMNGDPEQDLPAALRDRFPACMEIDKPHPDAITALPADLQDAARGTVCAESAERRITLRAWLAFGSMRGVVGEEVAAAIHFGRDRAADILQALRIGRE
jgi:MoxR-like ATPase